MVRVDLERLEVGVSRSQCLRESKRLSHRLGQVYRGRGGEDGDHGSVTDVSDSQKQHGEGSDEHREDDPGDAGHPVSAKRPPLLGRSDGTASARGGWHTPTLAQYAAMFVASV